MATACPHRTTWVNASAAARAAGVSRATVRRWADAALISCRRLPFCRPLYRLDDVLRLAEAHTRPATH